MRLLIIPAFGEIFCQWCAEVSASPPLSSTHYGPERLCSARVTIRSAAVVSSATRPPKPPCWVYYAPRCRQSRHRRAGLKGKRYARQSRPGPPQTRICLCPQPRGEMNDSGLTSNHRQCSAPQHNIIPFITTLSLSKLTRPRSLHMVLWRVSW